MWISWKIQSWMDAWVSEVDLETNMFLRMLSGMEMNFVVEDVRPYPW